MPNDVQLGIVLRADSKGLVGEVRVSRQELAKLGRATKRTGDSARASGGQFNRFRERLRRLRGEAGQAGQQFRSLRTVLAAVVSGAALRAVTQTALEYQRINRSLKAVFGSVEAASREFRFVEQQAERLGLSLGTAARDYAKLSAAAKGTALEGRPVREVFIGINEAAAALALTAEQTSGALTAIEQIISKGTVSAEELRGQLGERVPGAFQVAARAMGLTTQELGKQLALGKVLAEDLLPRMAREFRGLYSSEATAASAEATAQINRFHNSLFNLSRSFGQSGFLDEMASALDEISTSLADPRAQEGMRLFGSALGNTLKFMVEHSRVIIAVAGALAGGALGKFAGRLGNAFFSKATKLVGAGAGASAALLATRQDGSEQPRAPQEQTRQADYSGAALVSPASNRPDTATLKEIESAHGKAIASIITRQRALLPVFDQNVAKLIEWRNAAFANLDRSAEDYEKYKDKVDNIFSVEFARLYAEDAERQREAQRQKLESSARFTDGFRLGLARINEESQSRAQQIADGFGRAFSNMEDALANFVATGRLRFGAFVQSVIADLARIAIRENITQPLATAFAGGGSFRATAKSLAGASVGVPGPFVVHAGGVIGQDNLPRRNVTPALFQSAPRYHLGGLASDEVPAILRRGEEVLPRNDPRHRHSQGGTPVRVEIVNQGAPQQVKSASASITAKGIVVQAIVDDLTQNGPVAQGIQSAFGVRRRDY